MLRSIDELVGYNIVARDGEIGKVDDFLFDDQHWGLRYLVVDTGDWLPGRRVVIPPAVLGDPDKAGKFFPVDLTKDQVENSPPLKEHEPVSEQHQQDVHRHFGWSPYWVRGPFEGPVPAKPTGQYTSEADKESKQAPEVQEERAGDPHLRSAKTIDSYDISAKKDEVGHVDDLIVDDEDWSFRYIVADTGKWLPGRKVPLSVDWVTDLDWTDEHVHVAVEKEKIENSPEYDPSSPIERGYEERLFDYFAKPKYWLKSAKGPEGKQA